MLGRNALFNHFFCLMGNDMKNILAMRKKAILVYRNQVIKYQPSSGSPEGSHKKERRVEVGKKEDNGMSLQSISGSLGQL